MEPSDPRSCSLAKPPQGSRSRRALLLNADRTERGIRPNRTQRLLGGAGPAGQFATPCPKGRLFVRMGQTALEGSIAREPPTDVWFAVSLCATGKTSNAARNSCP